MSTILTFQDGAIRAIRNFCRWAGCRKADLLTSTLGRLWADFGPTLGRLWVDFGPTLGRLWADFGPTLGRLSADFRTTWGRLEANFGPTSDRLWPKASGFSKLHLGVPGEIGSGESGKATNENVPYMLHAGTWSGQSTDMAVGHHGPPWLRTARYGAWMWT